MFYFLTFDFWLLIVCENAGRLHRDGIQNNDPERRAYHRRVGRHTHTFRAPIGVISFIASHKAYSKTKKNGFYDRWDKIGEGQRRKRFIEV